MALSFSSNFRLIKNDFVFLKETLVILLIITKTHVLIRHMITYKYLTTPSPLLRKGQGPCRDVPLSGENLNR